MTTSLVMLQTRPLLTLNPLSLPKSPPELLYHINNTSKYPEGKLNRMAGSGSPFS